MRRYKVEMIIEDDESEEELPLDEIINLLKFDLLVGFAVDDKDLKITKLEEKDANANNSPTSPN